MAGSARAAEAARQQCSNDGQCSNSDGSKRVVAAAAQQQGGVSGGSAVAALAELQRQPGSGACANISLLY